MLLCAHPQASEKQRRLEAKLEAARAEAQAALQASVSMRTERDALNEQVGRWTGC